MKTYTLEQVIFITKYIDSHKDYLFAYIAALKVLGETAKSQWTEEDVFDAILRTHKEI